MLFCGTKGPRTLNNRFQRTVRGAAKILIDPFLSDNPSWDRGWIGSRAGEDSTQGGGR